MRESKDVFADTWKFWFTRSLQENQNFERRPKKPFTTNMPTVCKKHILRLLFTVIYSVPPNTKFYSVPWQWYLSFGNRSKKNPLSSNGTAAVSTNTSKDVSGELLSHNSSTICSTIWKLPMLSAKLWAACKLNIISQTSRWWAILHIWVSLVLANQAHLSYLWWLMVPWNLEVPVTSVKIWATWRIIVLDWIINYPMSYRWEGALLLSPEVATPPLLLWQTRFSFIPTQAEEEEIVTCQILT